jgi:AcrR family transcriptional regulator
LTDPAPARRPRADARRNLDALVEAAKTVFAESGVDAPAKQIADLAGVGVGTVYRHFPQRSDLVVAVFQRAVDVCAQAGPELAATLPPAEALSAWIGKYTGFIATKRGLAAALHSGDPAFNALPDYFLGTLGPTLQTLLDAAVEAGEIRPDVNARDLLHAIAQLCMPMPGGAPDHGLRMVQVLVDGLRLPHQPVAQ